jgi:hypothetical protein
MGGGMAVGYLCHKMVCVWKIFPKLANTTPTLTSFTTGFGVAVAVQLFYLSFRAGMLLFPNMMDPRSFLAHLQTQITTAVSTLTSMFGAPYLLECLGLTFTIMDLMQFIICAGFTGILTLLTGIALAFLIAPLVQPARDVAQFVRTYFSQHHLNLIEPPSHLPLII